MGGLALTCPAEAEGISLMIRRVVKRQSGRRLDRSVDTIQQSIRKPTAKSLAMLS